jgi:hypothetical protein
VRVDRIDTRAQLGGERARIGAPPAVVECDRLPASALEPAPQQAEWPLPRPKSWMRMMVPW